MEISNRLHCWEKTNGLPDDRITALYVDPNNDLYIGTGGNGLFIKRQGSSRIQQLIDFQKFPGKYH